MADFNEQLYFRDLDRYDVITPGEEVELLKRIPKGDKKALHRLIEGNLRFVVSIARKYQGRGLSLLELINEGNIGLEKAAHRFDPSKDVKFISYAVWWIRQTIQKALFEQVGAMHIPLNKLTLVNKFKRALVKNNDDFDKTIQMEEFKDYKQDIVEVMQKVTDVSLDAPFKSMEPYGEIGTLLDMIGKEGDQIKNSETEELKRVVDSILSKMSDTEQKVLRMYYGINYSREFTLDEIGKELKLTRERVRQIKNKALNKLLKSKESKDKLTPYSTGKSKEEEEDSS